MSLLSYRQGSWNSSRKLKREEIDWLNIIILDVPLFYDKMCPEVGLEIQLFYLESLINNATIFD